MPILANYTLNRDNNFNLVRFVAAVLVILNHSYVLTGAVDGDPMSQYGYSLGGVAVDVFFVISGFLVTSSLLSRGNLVLFVWARLLRVFPALVIANIFCVFFLGGFYTTTPIVSYISNIDIYKYFFSNTLLIIPPLKCTLPGVFNNSPHNIVTVNASLWTLPWEIRVYSLLILVSMVSRLFPSISYVKKLSAFILCIAICTVFFYLKMKIFQISNSLPSSDFIRLLRFTALFFSGATFYLFKNKIMLSSRIFIICIVAIFCSLDNFLIFFPLYNLTIGYLTLYVVYEIGGSIRLFNYIGDYSYGLYIYGFPVQQSILDRFPDFNVGYLFIFSFLVAFTLAIFSWHMVEKVALSYRRELPFRGGQRADLS